MNQLMLRRITKKISQKDMAKELGIAPSTYCQYESGLRAIPKETAENIANILECEVFDIFLPHKFTVGESPTA